MSATIIKVCDLFLGESIREDNGSQVGMPVFGKFAAIVRREELRVVEGPRGWYIQLPWGSTMTVGEMTKEETLERAVAIKSAGYQGWITDESSAREKAIADARSRHEAKMATSGGYRKLFEASK